MECFSYQGAQKKLSRVLCDTLPDYSYDYFRKLIRKGDVKINGKRTKEDIVLLPGDDVVVYCKEREFIPDVLYEDDNIFALNKFTGISSEKFAEKVNKLFPGSVLCHRLDTNTSGILLFAKNERIFELIKTVFANKLIEKHYLAEVWGNFPPYAEYSDFLEKDEKNGIVRIFTENAKNRSSVITKCTRIKCEGGVSVLDVEPVTGRTHQIRAHLAFHGYPILGDGKYGDVDVNKRFHTHIQHLTAYKIIFHCASVADLSYLDGLKIELQLNK